jgi:hypothetical protein
LLTNLCYLSISTRHTITLHTSVLINLPLRTAKLHCPLVLPDADDLITQCFSQLQTLSILGLTVSSGLWTKRFVSLIASIRYLERLAVFSLPPALAPCDVPDLAASVNRLVGELDRGCFISTTD